MVRLAFLLLALPLVSRADSLDSYVNAYYLAEGKLADFDAELASRPGEGFLVRSVAYHELIALKNILDEKAHEIETSLKAYPRNAPELRRFRQRIDKLDPAEKIAVAQLLPELRNVPLELPELFPSLDLERTARGSARALMQERTKRARLDSALNREVRSRADRLDFSEGRRERASSKIQPSASGDGTISGTNFPANTWALTYDDGPSAQYTPMVLANLAALKKKASFMWLTECLLANPTLPDAARNAGMPTNDHSWSHENLDKAPAADLAHEINQSSVKDAEFYGARPRFFRLPYGAGLHNQGVRQLIAENGMIHVFWNVDSLDWQDKDPASILKRVQGLMAAEKHGIILFHDIHPQSVEASKLVLQWSATLDGTPKALHWVTIPEIVDYLNRQ